MLDSLLIIREVVARPVMAPISRPVRTAVGVIPAAPLVLLDIHTEQGLNGRAYLFAYTLVTLDGSVYGEMDWQRNECAHGSDMARKSGVARSVCSPENTKLKDQAASGETTSGATFSPAREQTT